MPSKLEKLVDEFADDHESTGKRNHQTMANYRHYLRRFLQTTQAAAPAHITAAAVKRFRQSLQQRRPSGRLQASTVNYHLTALRSFVKYLQRRGVPTIAPASITLQPLPVRTVTTVETPGLNRLLNFPHKLDGRPVLQYRDRAILELLSAAGLRVGEVSRLQRDSLTASGSELAVYGRGGKLRLVPLTQQARYWISQYLKLRRDDAPQLFVRHDPASHHSLRETNASRAATPTGLTPRSMQRLMKKYALAAGLGAKVQPRTLRHTVAVNLLAAGNDLEAVRQRLGHTSVASTKIYLRQKNRRND